MPQTGAHAYLLGLDERLQPWPRTRPPGSGGAVLGTLAFGAALALGGLVVAPTAAADALTCAPQAGYTDCAAFSYTGADQTFAVPAGVRSVSVRAWGAGGGGVDPSYGKSQTGGAGGGFSSATVGVTPRSVLTVVVGQGGRSGPQGSGVATYGGGGAGGVVGGDAARDGASGGGLSGVFAGATGVPTALVVAGGGGGASPGSFGDFTSGGGGGTVGGADTEPAASGRGGTQTVGGLGGTSADGCTAPQIAGSGVTGGAGGGLLVAATGTFEGGGGGGGGYYGGGGGRCEAGGRGNGPGGGGSGFLVAGATGGVTKAGQNGVWSGFTGSAGRGSGQDDPLYVAGVGNGGASGVTGDVGNGGDGRVVVQWVGPPALSLVKTNPGSLVVGQSATYAFTVTNSGKSAATSATVVDRLPAGVAYVSSGGAGWSCSADGAVTTGQVVTCRLAASLPPKAVDSALAVTASPTVAAGGQDVANRAAVDPLGDGDVVDPTTCTTSGGPDGCAAPPAQNVDRGIRLGLTTSGPSPALAVGYPSTYVLTVTNSGVNPSPGALVRDALPAGLAFVSADGASCVASGTVTAGQSLRCEIPSTTVIPAGGGTATVSVVVRPVTAGTALVNRGAVDPVGGDSVADPASCTSAGTPAGCAVSPTADAVADVVTGPDLTLSTTAGVALTGIDVRSGTTSAQGRSLAAPTLVGQPAGGVASVGSDGTLTYVPNAGFSGVDSFTYAICNDGDPATCDASSTVTVTVANVFVPSTSTVVTTQNTPVVTLLSDIVTAQARPLDPGSVAVVVPPSHGGLTIDAGSGAVTYTPQAGYTGSDSYQVRVCDTSVPPQCTVVTREVSVGPNVVRAADDSVTTSPGTAVDVDVRANDTSASGQALGAPTLGSDPAKGTVSVLEDGRIRYDPLPGTSGVDSFVYRVCDTSTPSPVCASATVSVSVVNTVAAVADSATVAENGSVVVPVLANDTVSPGGAALSPGSVSLTALPAHGSAVVDPATGAVTYRPTAGYAGTDSLAYQVCDTSTPMPVCASAVVSITVTANTVVAVDDAATTLPGEAIATDVRVNDTSATGQPLGLPSVSAAPAKGTAVVDASSGVVTYTPRAGTSGLDRYDYEICDTSIVPMCDTGTVVVAVVNEVTAVDDSATTAQNTPVTVAVLANDAVRAGGAALDPRSVSITAAPTSGSAVADVPAGTVTYSPAAGFSGTDSFRYQVCDLSTPTPVCGSAVVSVAVGANSVVAVDDSVSTAPSTEVTVDVRANDTSSTGQPLGAPSVVTGPAAGVVSAGPGGTLVYTPATGTSGLDSFRYQVCDTSMPMPVCATATVTVTVVNVVTAVDDSVTTAQNAAVSVPVLANDTVSAGGAPLTASSLAVVSEPAHGTASVSSGVVLYTPATGYSGSDSFRYQVCDSSSPSPVCASATVSVTVGANSVVAVDDAVTVAPVTLVTVDVRANDRSASGQSLGLPSIVGGPGKGSVTVEATGGVTYVSRSGSSGVDSYRYQVCDTSATPVCATATVTVTVTNTVTAVDDQATTEAETPVETAVLDNDVVTRGGAPLDAGSLAVIRQPAHGTAAVVGSSVRYTPAAGYSGTDAYAYQVCDTSTPSAVCATGSVSVTVTAASPVMVDAVDDTASTVPLRPVTTTVLSNDSVPAGSTPVISVVVAPTKGSTTVQADGSVVYTPQSGTSGTDRYAYRVCVGAVCDDATVTVSVVSTVTAVNDSRTSTYGMMVSIPVLANDSVTRGGAPLDPSSVRVTTAPKKGYTRVDLTTGAVTYVPGARATGTDSFVYQVCDTSTPTPVCASATVTVSIAWSFRSMMDVSPIWW